MDNVKARTVSMIEVTYNTGDGTEKIRPERLLSIILQMAR